MSSEKPSVDSDGDDVDTVKRSKHRSPNHPVLDLKTAIEKVETLHKTYGVHAISFPTFCKAFNYKIGSIPGQLLAALRYYGLVEVAGVGDGRKITVSKEATRILGNAPNRPELLRQAALSPAIHQEVWDHYQDSGGLPHNDVLETYLCWERPDGQRFYKDTVGDFIARLRQTFEYAGIGKSGTIPDGTPPVRSEEKPRRPLKAGDIVTSSNIGLGFDFLKVQGLSEDGEWAFLEGIEGAQLVSTLTPSSSGDAPAAPLFPSPPPNPFARHEKVDQSQPGRKQDVYTLPEGDVTLHWPSRLSRESYDEVKDWFDLLLRKLNRAVGVDKPSDD